MRLRRSGSSGLRIGALLAVTALAFGALSVPVAADAAGAAVHPTATHCTRTSSGSCIRGGEFCPKADYNHVGHDAQGRRYVCKGNRSHPHWMK